MVYQLCHDLFLALLADIADCPTYTSFRNSSKSGIAFVDGYSLMNYEKAFARMNNTIFNTIFIGVTTLIVIVLFAILKCYRRCRRIYNAGRSEGHRKLL